MFAKSVRDLANQTMASLYYLALSLVSACNPLDIQRLSSQPENKISIELTISAAASMQNALSEIKVLYQQKYPQVNLIFNFASSGSLQRQIEQGAPIDIFISAAAQQMNILESKELLLGKTRRDLVQNQMVLIAPKDNNLITTFADLANESTGRVALGEISSVPAGQYAQEIFTSLSIEEQIKPKSIYGKNVRQVLSYVATGNVDAGIVYGTDAKMEKEVKIIAMANQNNHSAVVYPAAVVRDSNYPEAAQKLLQFLFSTEAQSIFQTYGFRSIDNRQ